MSKHRIYAIKRPGGQLIPAVATSSEQAWWGALSAWSKLNEMRLSSQGTYTWIDMAMSRGYRCVEVELVEKRP